MTLTRCLAGLLAAALATELAGCSNAPNGGGPVDPPPDPVVPPPIITEFVSKNQASLLDDDGEPSDWIELYNPHDVAIDLGGFHLTDRKSDTRQWSFPKGTVLQPATYLVVFASGKDRRVAGKPLHTNFKSARRHSLLIPRLCIADLLRT